MLTTLTTGIRLSSLVTRVLGVAAIRAPPEALIFCVECVSVTLVDQHTVFIGVFMFVGQHVDVTLDVDVTCGEAGGDK